MLRGLKWIKSSSTYPTGSILALGQVETLKPYRYGDYL